MSSVWDWPLKTGPSGQYAELEGIDAVDQALRHLILTEPGERLQNPNLGVPLRRLIYEPVRLVSEALARTYIKLAVRSYLSEVQLIKVDVKQISGEETAGFQIAVIWRHVESQHQLRRTSFSRIFEKTS
jgi:phage baseplate assembly protein W